MLINNIIREKSTRNKRFSEVPNISGVVFQIDMLWHGHVSEKKEKWLYDGEEYFKFPQSSAENKEQIESYFLVNRVCFDGMCCCYFHRFAIVFLQREFAFMLSFVLIEQYKCNNDSMPFRVSFHFSYPVEN